MMCQPYPITLYSAREILESPRADDIRLSASSLAVSLSLGYRMQLSVVSLGSWMTRPAASRNRADCVGCLSDGTMCASIGRPLVASVPRVRVSCSHSLQVQRVETWRTSHSCPS